ncbi:recombinase family protein [Prescottella equi]|uniref:recombinase family protein n=1 Tax=Rhodococcus hoagii TaxID=43767 RepID=UPI001F5BB759|nr:recombinase family protein [Prescottella equi]UNQ40224.1 recombinase family protein [Prescottella equi]
MVGSGNRTRALIVVRLSRVTDETTSPERQREACEQLCAERGWVVVGLAQDLDVSAGKTSPFDRPALKEWIGDGKADPGRADEFDVIVFFRLDRLVRSVSHLWRMIEWSEEHGTLLVSATEKHFDLSDRFGKVIVSLIATVAELELDAISERNASAFRHNYRAGKWRGGVPPWGYLPEETEQGWRLVQDPLSVSVILSVVERVLAGEPLRSIAHDLTERNVLTPKDRFAQHRGREPKGFKWHSAPLKRSLTSPTLLGYAVSRDEILRGDDGSPIVRSEPILSKSVFDRLGVELGDRENRKEPTKRTTSLLLQVVFCAVCGRPCYRLKGGAGRASRYRCASAQYKETCGNRTVVCEELDDLVESTVLSLLGDSERLERTWDAGEDVTTELAEVNFVMNDLANQMSRPAFRPGTPQREALDARIDALAKRRDELEAATTRPAGWMWKPTGETFAVWWERQTAQEKNIYLRSMGVTVQFDKREDLRVNLELGALDKMATEIESTGSISAFSGLFKSMTEQGIEGVEIAGDKTVFVSKSGERVEIPTDDAGE